MKIVKQWVQEDSDFIRKKVIEYNSNNLPDEKNVLSENISFVIRNDQEDIVGGITGRIYWHHLSIEFLWVSEDYRHEGFGSKLIKQMEEFAIEKDCRLIKVDTFSFQAPEFYKNHGFKVFGVIEDHPNGHNQYYFEKRL
ncbi:GNAT family N-acetyltransferase [Gottfriedia sp. NPDC056225]|uniref:GNAT family N-acetyltransferase n=1 Tax=Gottfriedia sp. NPDC056225 TaxID=3345751 RepID=UPI0035E20387